MLATAPAAQDLSQPPEDAALSDEFTEPAPTEPPDLPPPATSQPFAPGTVDWGWVRNQWALNWGEVDLSAMLFASNPKPVRDAIERHRIGLDAQPIRYLERNNRPLQNLARSTAARYFGAVGNSVALCESTTSGLALLYHGLTLRPYDEVLTSTHDYFSTHESLRLATERNGASLRRIPLFEDPRGATAEEIAGLIAGNIRPQTRVLALTWVHSSTGFKMPIAQIAQALAPINAARPPQDKVLFCVDGVHGFGVEDTTFRQLGCDFLVAGCHKWLFGPRGTGVVFGTPLGWSRVKPVVPSFLTPGSYSTWLTGAPPGRTTPEIMTPGGFKAFEHVWALTDAFQFHEMIGRGNIAARTADLATRAKEGLSRMPHINLRTPMNASQSAGVISFDVNGADPDAVVKRLRAFRILASTAPYNRRHVRLAPSMRNTYEDIDYALNSIDRIRPAPKRAPARPRAR